MLHKTIIGKHFTLNKDYLTYNLKERIKDDLFKSFSYLKLKITLVTLLNYMNFGNGKKDKQNISLNVEEHMNFLVINGLCLFGILN